MYTGFIKPDVWPEHQFGRPGVAKAISVRCPSRLIANAWKTPCQAAGCPGRIPHDLRRTADATIMLGDVAWESWSWP